MKEKARITPLSELETTVEGLVPETGTVSLVLYVLSLAVLASLIIAVTAICL